MAPVRSKESKAGIKNYFATNVSKKADLPHESADPVSRQGKATVYDLDTENEDTNCKQKSTKVVNMFFLPKAKKQELIAQEREARIQEEISKKKREVDCFLTKTASSGGGVSAFFQARTQPTAHAAKAAESVEIVEIDDTPEVGHMKLCCSGVSEALLSVQQRRATLASAHLPRRVSVMDQECASVDSVGLSQCATSRLAADWAGLTLSWALPGITTSNAYPLAQAHLNLRAAWLQWVLHRASLLESRQAAVKLNLGLSGDLSTAQEDVLRWLERWATKRRVSLSRSSTKSRSRTSSQRPSSQRSSLSRGSTPSTASKGSRRGRRQGGRKGRESSDDSSTSESEQEWSDGTGESDEELGEEGLEDSDGDGCEGSASTGRRGTSSTRRAAGIAALSATASTSVDEECESLSNVLVLEGPSGCGKSAAVHDCARRLGYRVIEVNASQTRSGAAVRKTIAEAAQSAHILDNGGGASSSSAETSLILFDEVDIVFEEEGDVQLYSAIQQIAQVSKCPIVLTTERPLPFFQALRAKHVAFKRAACRGKEALQALAACSRAASEHARTDGSTGAAPPTLFGPKTPQAKAKGTGTPNSASAAPCQLGPREKEELEVLCGLSGGDMRAAAAAMQLFPGAYFSPLPSSLPRLPPLPPAVSHGQPIDLTASPVAAPRGRVSETAVEDSPSVGSVNFAVYLRDVLRLDFAAFDSALERLCERWSKPDSAESCPVTGPGADLEKGGQVLLPVVHSVSPRSGLCSGGFAVTIQGSHFLQSSFVGETPEVDALARVQVLLDGTMQLPCAVKSSTHIVAYIPPGCAAGVHTIVVQVHAGVWTVGGGVRIVTASSTGCGVAGGWIRLFDRGFPPLPLAVVRRGGSRASLTSQGSSSQAGPAVEDGATSDADTDIVDSEGDTGPAADCGIGPRRKRTRGGNDDKVTSSTQKNGTAVAESEVPQSHPKRRRAGLVVMEEEGEDEGEGVCVGQVHGTATAVDDGADVRSEADTELASSQGGDQSADANHPLNHPVDRAELEGICREITAAARASLEAVLDSTLSGPFLEPVSDTDAPGYSTAISRPMDLGTVQQSVEEGLYDMPLPGMTPPASPAWSLKDLAAFVDDVRLVWHNCLVYNGEGSSIVRSAFLLQHIFEQTLVQELSNVAERHASAVRFVQSNTSTGLHWRDTDEPVVRISPSTVFESCVKLRRSLPAARVQALLAETNQASSSPVPAAFATEEEVLGQERVSDLALLAELRMCVAQKSGGDAGPAPVPGLDMLPPSHFHRHGLEYESPDVPTYTPLLRTGGISRKGSDGRGGSKHDRDALTALQEAARLCDAYCDADRLSTASVCYGVGWEEDPVDSSFRDFMPLPTQPATTGGLEASRAALYFAECASLLACSVRAEDTHFKESHFLRAQERRLEVIGLVKALTGGYVSYPGGRASNPCEGLLGGARVESTTAAPRLLTLDIMPVVAAMCAAEKERDEEALQLIDGLSWLNDEGQMGFMGGTRTTRRSRGRRPSHVCFEYMKSTMSGPTEGIYHSIAATLKTLR